MDIQHLWLEAQGLAAELPDQPWRRLTRMAMSSGIQVRRQAGDGQDFWQYRHLSDGDSVAGVDWRKSARSDMLLLREREQQHRQRAWLWCDMSPSMHYAGSRAARSKAAHGYLIAATLLHLAANAGEQLSLLHAPQARRHDLPHQLAQHQPFDMSHVSSADLLFIVSDFLDFDCSATHGPIVALHIMDPDEQDFPFQGHIRFEGLEDEAPRLVGNANMVQAAYLAGQHALQQRISAMAMQAIICSSGAPAGTQVQQLMNALLA
jgi:uncharacterized protein (DUF58 family)